MSLNILKTFLYIIVSFGAYIYYFPFAETKQMHKYAFLTSPYPSRQESNITVNIKELKTNLYVYNTNGDVALTSIIR